MNAPVRSEFLAERRTGLGGSDMGAILGLSKYRSPLQIWLEKTGREAPSDSNLAMRFGTYAEQFVAEEYTAETGRRVQRFTPMLRHPDYPMVIGRVDRLVIPEGAKRAAHQREIRTDTLLEAKTASPYALQGDEWGSSGTDLIPAAYLCQTAVYMALTGCAHADLACLFGNAELRVYHLHRDMDLEQELLRRAAEWWQAHVIADVAPEPQSEADVRLLYPRDNQQEIDADAETAEAVAWLADRKTLAKEIEAEEQAARDRITAYMGEAAVLRYMGQTLCTYKAAKDSDRTDWKAVAKALNPSADLIAANTSTVAGSRRLLLK